LIDGTANEAAGVKRSEGILLNDLVFPEAPRWHRGELWFSDIYAHRVMAVTPGGVGRIVALLDQPSGLGFLPDGSLLVACMRERVIRRVQDGRVSDYADLGIYPGDYINDMIVDADGNAYVGNRSHAGPGANGDDSLVIVRPDRTHEMAADGLTAPNGTVVTADGARLIVAETHALRLTMFDRSPDGSLAERRTFAALPPAAIDVHRPPYPDGICLDADYAVWVGTAISGQFLRIGEGGAVLDRITPQAPWGVACALGGEGRRTLFMTTCSTTLEGLRSLADASGPVDAAYLEWARSLSTGQIEVASVGAGGVGTP
jgi:sugar lactone lactonase YvrE